MVLALAPAAGWKLGESFLAMIPLMMMFLSRFCSIQVLPLICPLMIDTKRDSPNNM